MSRRVPLKTGAPVAISSRAFACEISACFKSPEGGHFEGALLGLSLALALELRRGESC